jgi:hypothetical protein
MEFTRLVGALQVGLHGFSGAWLRCNSLEWDDHSASLRLALHPKNRTLQPVQLRFLGLWQNVIAKRTMIEFAEHIPADLPV